MKRHDTLLNSSEAADFLRISRNGLYAATRRGEIPALKLGKRRLRFRLRELEQLIKPLRKSNYENKEEANE